MRKPRGLAILATAACLFGIVVATPPIAPTAKADSLPNGYNVTCTPNGQGAVCNVSGCPRVKGDEAGDVIHVGGLGNQQELSKGCDNNATFPIEFTSKPITFSIQGCRKHPVGSDDCGAWSSYTYTPPAGAAPAPADGQKPVHCTGGQTLPAGASCAAAPAAAPVQCPAGSDTPTVPAGQQCAAPTNAVAMNITQHGLNANAAITNKSGLPAHCTYTATRTSGIAPQEVDRTIDVGADSTSAITDMLWPPPLVSYHAVVRCTATYNGKQVSIGESSQNVSG
jgi:hypothetical protein